jgi:hypothetical protein
MIAQGKLVGARTNGRAMNDDVAPDEAILEAPVDVTDLAIL